MASRYIESMVNPQLTSRASCPLKGHSPGDLRHVLQEERAVLGGTPRATRRKSCPMWDSQDNKKKELS